MFLLLFGFSFACIIGSIYEIVKKKGKRNDTLSGITGCLVICLIIGTVSYSNFNGFLRVKEVNRLNSTFNSLNLSDEEQVKKWNEEIKFGQEEQFSLFYLGMVPPIYNQYNEVAVEA